MADRSIKAAQLADQIRDYLAAWTAREYPGSFVVVTQVTLTPNLREATAWVRLIGNEAKTSRQLIADTKGYQHKLRGALKRAHIPTLQFAFETESEGLPDLLT